MSKCTAGIGRRVMCNGVCPACEYFMDMAGNIYKKIKGKYVIIPHPRRKSTIVNIKE